MQKQFGHHCLSDSRENLSDRDKVALAQNVATKYKLLK